MDEFLPKIVFNIKSASSSFLVVSIPGLDIFYCQEHPFYEARSRALPSGFFRFGISGHPAPPSDYTSRSDEDGGRLRGRCCEASP